LAVGSKELHKKIRWQVLKSRKENAHGRSSAAL
jgi:hypothetical protein